MSFLGAGRLGAVRLRQKESRSSRLSAFALSDYGETRWLSEAVTGEWWRGFQISLCSLWLGEKNFY